MISISGHFFPFYTYFLSGAFFNRTVDEYNFPTEEAHFSLASTIKSLILNLPFVFNGKCFGFLVVVFSLLLRVCKLKDVGRFVYFGRLQNLHTHTLVRPNILWCVLDCTMICIVHMMVDMSKHIVFVFDSQQHHFNLTRSHRVHFSEHMKICAFSSLYCCKC